MSTKKYAETYTWTDSQGSMHFVDQLSSVPPKYRKQAIANMRAGINATDESEAQDRRYRESARRQELTEQTLEYQRRAQEQADSDRQKLKTIVCTGVFGECGPGRTCLMYSNKSSGVCKTEAEADRLIAEFNQEKEARRQRRNEIRETLRDQKLDRIERNQNKLLYGY